MRVEYKCYINSYNGSQAMTSAITSMVCNFSQEFSQENSAQVYRGNGSYGKTMPVNFRGMD